MARADPARGPQAAGNQRPSVCGIGSRLRLVRTGRGDRRRQEPHRSLQTSLDRPRTEPGLGGLGCGRTRPQNALTPERGVDGALGVVLDLPQMAFAAETLRIDLVD